MNTIASTYSNSHDRNVGIDVGKTNLDIFIFELDQHWQVSNTQEDIRGLLVSSPGQRTTQK